MITITRSGVTMNPDMVLEGYELASQAGNVIHRVLGRADPDVTFRPAGMRTGTLRLFFKTSAAALTCFQQHRLAGVFTLTDTALPAMNMSYVPAGRITERPDPQSGRWTVTVDVQEVLT